MARRVRTRTALVWGGGGLVLVGVVTLVVGVVVAVAVDLSWWDGGDASVRQDGRPHVVRVDGPGGAYAIWSDRSLPDPTCSLTDSDGAPVPLAEVPPAKRAYVDTSAVAEPEASFLFTAPADGSVTITCDIVEAVSNPGMREDLIPTLDLAPAPDHSVVALMNVAPVLPGASLILLGLAVGLPALVAAGIARRRARRMTAKP